MSSDEQIADQLVHYYLKAYEQGKLHEYEYTFLECRKAAELILITLCERYQLNFNKRERQIEQLIGLLQGQLPRVVEASIRLIQSLGNYGSHHQRSRERETDKLFIEPCIVATKSLIQWLYPESELERPEQRIHLKSSRRNSTSSTSEANAPAVVTMDEATLRVRLRNYVETTYKVGEEFKIGDLKKSFRDLNPHNSPNAIHGHTCFMTTNLASRLSHHIKTDGSDDLLFRVSRGIYRRYQPEIDPPPIYPNKP